MAPIFGETFGAALPESYKPFAEDVGASGWDYGANSPFAHFAFGRRLNGAFDVNPEFRLLIGNGYHDTMTTVGAARYAFLQSDWPADRVRLSWYRGGHMAYSMDVSAAKLGDDIRDWIGGWDTGTE